MNGRRIGDRVLIVISHLHSFQESESKRAVSSSIIAQDQVGSKVEALDRQEVVVRNENYREPLASERGQLDRTPRRYLFRRQHSSRTIGTGVASVAFLWRIVR